MTPGATELHRVIGLRHATAMVVGTIIGASIFVQPSEVIGQVPSMAGAALVWLTAGVLTMCGALVVAELASSMPASGGVYVYLREQFGGWLGFLWGWAMFWVMHSGIIAAIAMVFASYAAFVFPLDDLSTRLVAVATILVLSAVNYRGVRHGSDLQAAFTLVKVAAIVLIVVVGLAFGRPPAGEAVDAGASIVSGTGELDQGFAILGGGGLSDFVLAVSAALFAFGGWHMVSYNAEETIEPHTTIPRALMWGVAIVTACYVALNGMYFYLLPLDTVIESRRIAADAANAVIGTGGGQAMTALVLFSTFGALSGIVLSGPRVYYAMARDGLLFGWVGEVHPRFRTPHRAVILQAIWASALVLTGTYRALFTRVVYTEWIFFGVMALGLIKLRMSAAQAPAYRLPGFPFTPLAFALAAFAIVINHIISDPAGSLSGLGIVAAGLPVYAIWTMLSPSERSI